MTQAEQDQALDSLHDLLDEIEERFPVVVTPPGFSGSGNWVAEPAQPGEFAGPIIADTFEGFLSCLRWVFPVEVSV